MNQVKNEFKESVCIYMSAVNSQNFSGKYDGLVQIVVDFNIRLPKNAILDILNDLVVNNHLDEWQEEIAGEIIARISGQCTPGKVIELK